MRTGAPFTRDSCDHLGTSSTRAGASELLPPAPLAAGTARLRDWRLQWADTCDQYCRGAMLSMALGHALGAAIEFMPPPKDNEARQRARMERLLPSWFRRSAPSSSQQRDGDQRNFSGHDDVLTSDDDLDEDDDVPALGHEEPGGNSGGVDRSGGDMNKNLHSRSWSPVLCYFLSATAT